MVIQNKVFVFIGNPGGNLQGITPGMIKNHLRELVDFDEHELSTDYFDLENLTISTENLIGVKVIGTEDSLFWKTISKTIKAELVTTGYKSVKPSSLFLLKSNYPVWYLRSQLPIVETAPMIPLTSQMELENLFSSSFDWQKCGIESALKSLTQAEEIYNSQRNMSMHTDIPVGNFPIQGDHSNWANQYEHPSYSKAKLEYHTEEMYSPNGYADLSLFVSDSLLSRQLHAKKHLLWCSRTNKPDLGSSNYNLLENNLSLSISTEKKQIFVSEPGCYRTISVEINISKLAVAAIVNTVMVDDAEGGSAATNFGKLNELSLQEMMQGVNKRDQITQHDQAALTSNTFGILRKLVSQWMKITTSRDENLVAMANELLSNCHRWVKSEASLLFDPAIYDQLHSYMKRYFFHLISEFKRLGATVIHADFNRIILDTKKRGLKDAQNYIKYILEKILNNNCYRALEFEVENWWSFLIWMDTANYSGMHVEDVSEQDLDDTCANFAGLVNNHSVYRYNLSMVNYLSKIGNIRENFLSIIEKYVISNHRDMMGALDENPVGSTPLVRRKHNDSSMMITQENEKENSNPENTENTENSENSTKKMNFSINYLENTLQSQVVTAVEKATKERRKFKTVNECYVRSLPGTRSTSREPVLDFIKAICRTLELDPQIQGQVVSMKNNLLRLVGVGAFAAKAEWTEICDRKVIIDIPCATCNQTMDLDICTDLNLLSAIENKEPIEWVCNHCGSQLSNARTTIELDLLQELQTLSASYFTQDIKCGKCKDVSGRYLKKYCSKDARAYQNSQPIKSIGKQLKTLRQIATAYNFETLLENLDFFMTT